MKNELDYSFYIERYLDGEMSKDEKLWFTRELKGDPVLKKELELRKKMNDAVRETDVINFRKQLQGVFETSRVETIGRSHAFHINSRIAVSLSAFIIAVAGGLLLLIPDRNMENKEIYETYFSPAEPGLTFRSEENAADMELRTAMQYYENGDYEQALHGFENILRSDSSRIGINLYSGISQMEIARYRDANASFHKIINNKYILYIEQAEWYLAFCYLMMNDRKKAGEQFGMIADRKGYYQHQARKILKRIN
jgi:tetratricopeptide (TPR) repeat protein